MPDVPPPDGAAPDGPPAPNGAPSPADAQAPPPVSPTPSPAPTPVTVPAPAGKKQTATEARLAAAAVCAAHDPSCDWLATFSSLERNSIRRTLVELKLEPEPEPWGKVIGRVHVRNEDVFAEKNWLRFFNIFHVTTRAQAVHRELTLEEGEIWDEERIIESARRIRDPLYTSVVALLPVKSADPSKVDLLVVTRDIWSLRLNTKWDVQGDRLVGFTMSISENNFLGRRKTVALGFIMDQGAIATGPLYIDKNFLGLEHHFDLRARIDRIFTRRSLDVNTIVGEGDDAQIISMPSRDPGGIQDDGKLRAEGTAATISLTKPLWSLASKWGAGGSVSYRNAISRSYRLNGLRGYDDPETPDPDFLPREYRMRTWSVRAAATRQWGDEFKQAVEVGYTVASQRPTLLDYPAFQVDELLLEHFQRDVFPRDEVVSAPFIEYAVFQKRFATTRNVDTYELAEDVRFGPNLSVSLSQTFKTLGSTHRFTRPALSMGWTFRWGRDGFARVSAGGQLRIQDGETIDNTATAQIRAATPTLSFFRLIAQVHTETRWNDQSNSDYTLGSESGLRAYAISEFFGDRRIVGQLEARSVPFPVWVVRLGGVLFYDGGGAADTFKRMEYFHDVGFGARMLIPQSSGQLFRFDLSFPLVDGQATDAAGRPITRAGYPKFIAGFDSYF